MDASETEEQKNQIWRQMNDVGSSLHTEFMAEYSRSFKIEAILLRSEIMGRLPGFVQERETKHLYEFPTNSLVVEEIADDLETLGRSLP